MQSEYACLKTNSPPAAGIFARFQTECGAGNLLIVLILIPLLCFLAYSFFTNVQSLDKVKKTPTTPLQKGMSQAESLTPLEQSTPHPLPLI